MKTSYSESFDVKFFSEEGQSNQVCKLEGIDSNAAYLTIITQWENSPQKFNIQVVLPVAQPVRFTWDDGLFGYKIITNSRVERFCQPRLVSKTLERIARLANPLDPHAARPYINTEVLDWQWESWFDRVHDAVVGVFELATSRLRRPTAALLQRDIQSSIRRLVNGGGRRDGQQSPGSWSPGSRSPKRSGLHLTDEAKILRHLMEVELGYPDVSSDQYTYEKLKLRYLQYVDNICDIVNTGKTDTGRFVIRTRPNGVKSHNTDSTIADFSLAVNPLAPWGNIVRIARENRSIIQAHEFVNPITPPITVKGIKTPESLAQRITTLTCCICDIRGFNTFRANQNDVDEFDGRVELEEETCLDTLLITPSGRKKLLSYQPKSKVMEGYKFLPILEDLKTLPGFEYEELPELIETLEDGTQVFDTYYRYWYKDPVRCRFDKLKILLGGIKGVSRPIAQLYTKTEVDLQEVDIVISETALLSKGGRDAAIYPLLANAGITEVDPEWTWEDLQGKITKGLSDNGLPKDGRTDVFIKRWEEIETSSLVRNGDQMWKSHIDNIGRCIVGPIPTIRAEECESRQASDSRGVSLDVPTRMIAGIPISTSPESEEKINRIAAFFCQNSISLEEAQNVER